MQIHLRNKHNLVLYIDKELVEKSKDLGFNLSKTFENYLKQLINQFSTVNSANNCNSSSKKARALTRLLLTDRATDGVTD